MFPIMLAAATTSLIHFTLDSGANVEVSYAPTYISEAEAIRTSVPMAKTIWKDFCGLRPGLRGDSGEYYKIDLALLVAKGLEKESANSCQGSISYMRRYAWSEVRPMNFEQWGFYDCYSGANNQLHIVRDQMELPAVVQKPSATPSK